MKALLALFMCLISTASAQQQATLRGKVLGADGKPMALAHVRISRYDNFVVPIVPDKDGSFFCPLKERGGYDIRVTGTSHQPGHFTFCVTNADTITVTMHLQSYEHLTPIGEIALTGNFNNYRMYDHTVPMKKQRNGTWVGTVTSDSTLLRYQVLGLVEVRSINGTMAEGYELDDAGDYFSLLSNKHKKTKITLDLSKYPMSTAPAYAVFADTLNQLIELHRLRRDRWNDAMERLADDAPSGIRSFIDSMKLIQDSTYKVLLRNVDAFQEGTLRDCARLQALDWGLMNRLPDSTLLPHVRLLQVDNPVLTVYNWTFAKACYQELAQSRSATNANVRGGPEIQPVQGAPVSALMDAYENTKVPGEDKAEMLSCVMGVAATRGLGDSTVIRILYQKFMNKYASSRAATLTKAYYNYDAAIAPGKQCPAFSVKNMDDTTLSISERSIRGDVVLLHFWSTELNYGIPKLEELHAQYAKDGLEILSFALDNTREEVQRYRKENTPMKWIHGIQGQKLEWEFFERFDVPGAPYLILLDRDGSILMSGIAPQLFIEGLPLEIRAAVLKEKNDDRLKLPEVK